GEAFARRCARWPGRNCRRCRSRSRNCGGSKPSSRSFWSIVRRTRVKRIARSCGKSGHARRPVSEGEDPMKRLCWCIAMAVATCAALTYLGVSRATPLPAHEQDEVALRGMQAQFASAWSKSDAHDIAALFAPDADLIIPSGVVMRGQQEI